METKSKPETRGERIKRLRTDGGYTQLSLATKIGVTKAAVSKWESAASPDIELATFFKLAVALDIDPQELATGAASVKSVRDDIPPHRLNLIRLYGRLPPEVRHHIRGMITILAAAQSDRYATWSREQGERAVKRDSKKKDTV